MSESFAQRVERLKRNNIAFGKLPTEDQRVFASIGRKHCVFSSQTWETLRGNGMFCDSDIYRIRPDYQPETLQDVRDASQNIADWLNGTGRTNKSRRSRIPAKLLEALEAALTLTEEKK